MISNIGSQKNAIQNAMCCSFRLSRVEVFLRRNSLLLFQPVPGFDVIVRVRTLLEYQLCVLFLLTPPLALGRSP